MQVIIKSGPDTIRTIDYIPTSHYTYLEPEKLNWQIRSNTLAIGRFLCQKATITLGGRRWTAWFTPELAIPDEPFKFSGLPGLIIRLADDQHYFQYRLY